MLFIGVVENNIDEEKLGRCQVRIFGKHDDNKSNYPTTDLPWATCLFHGPSISEECDFKIPNNGDFVAVVFFDQEEQFPVIIGTIPKLLKTLPDFSIGFSDPNQTYPDSDHLDESSISRLARNENIDQTIIETKKNAVKTGVSCGDTTFDEPETLYNATYPNNRVIQTRHHVIELDDTSGVERIHIYHKTGTSIEMHPNGDSVEIIKAKKFLIVEDDENSYVGGDFNIHIGGDENKEITGKQTETVNEKKITSTTKIILDATGNVEITSGANINVTASGIVNIQGTTINLN